MGLKVTFTITPNKDFRPNTRSSEFEANAHVNGAARPIGGRGLWRNMSEHEVRGQVQTIRYWLADFADQGLFPKEDVPSEADMLSQLKSAVEAFNRDFAATLSWPK